MKTRVRGLIAATACLVLLTIAAETFAQSGSDSLEKLWQKANKDFSAGKFADAEHDFRDILKQNSSNTYAQLYLGHALFRQEKYSEAIIPYEKARELDGTEKKLSPDQRRVLIDQLAMAYGISGDLEKSRILLEDAIHVDPNYPLNYYNLACVFAEQDNKKSVLSNLALAFQHKDNVLKGEKMPDPRTDSSFQKYARDDEFTKLMKELGYNEI